MTRWPLLLCILLAFALGAAACGDDGEGGSSDSPDQILSETFGKDKDVKSGRLGLDVRIATKGIPSLTQPVSLRLSGPFASVGQDQLPKFALTAEIEANGQTFSGGATSTGDKGYLSFMGQNYQLGKELFDQFKKGYADQAKCNRDKGGGGVTLSSLGVDPRRWLTDVKKVGGEEVGGAQTTHLTAGVDVPKMLEDVNRVLGRTDLQKSDPCATSDTAQPDKTAPRQLSADERKQIADAVKSARVDLWSGDDDRILRRINVALQLADKTRSGDVKFDLTLGDINKEQTIEEPENAKPLEELSQSLGGAIPGLGGTGSSGSGSSGGGSTGSSGSSGSAGGASSEYLQCVQSAGQDVAKLQQCADLVNK